MDYVGASMLAVAGAAIGTSRALTIKPGWSETSLLYVANVGSPGSGKTPAMDAVAQPFYGAQKRLFKEHKDVSSATV
jgi:hypothetical protein